VFFFSVVVCMRGVALFVGLVIVDIWLGVSALVCFFNLAMSVVFCVLVFAVSFMWSLCLCGNLGS